MNTVTRYATCSTSGCSNAKHPIPATQEEGTSVVCGVCAKPITDVADDPPELPKEMPSWEI